MRRSEGSKHHVAGVHHGAYEVQRSRTHDVAHGRQPTRETLIVEKNEGNI